MNDQYRPFQPGRRRRRRRRGHGGQPGAGLAAPAGPAAASGSEPQPDSADAGAASTQDGTSTALATPPRPAPPRAPQPQSVRVSGIFEARQDGSGQLRQVQRSLEWNPADPFVPAQLAHKFAIRNGCEVEAEATSEHRGPCVRHIHAIDRLPVHESRQRRSFKKLTVIDPDFHYELGTCAQDGQLSMRIIDLLCPIGRGQRALIVAPPRSGKTILMQQIAHAVEELYPDVHLIVLLVDERPEEATGWRRSVRHGEVYASTLDETPQNHVRLAELVQERAERLVEAGHQVMILLDSLTRLSRAYNQVIGNSGKTLSGGLDAKTMARPKAFFGAARNTEEKGALTIVATVLVDTGSRMDQVIFEEFKGTGNMELVLDRHLADRRIFPAIAVDRTGTRKEEKLLSRATLRKVNILRRVLGRMKPLEAMELLVNRLAQFPANQDFLNAFSLEDVE